MKIAKTQINGVELYFTGITYTPHISLAKKSHWLLGWNLKRRAVVVAKNQLGLTENSGIVLVSG